nr:hypothetical protein [uncultured Flavobacterium sp.]
MSEPSSLYCKVKITKSQLEKFLNSPPEKPELNNNWLEWWESRDMYSKMDLTPELLRCYNDKSNQEVLDGWMKYDQSMTYSDYDETTEEWNVGIIMFGENYLEMIPMFAFIISLQNYIIESPENKAFVFPYFWGDRGVHAFIEFKENKAILNPNVQSTEELNPDLLNNAIEYLDKKYDELSKNMEMD